MLARVEAEQSQPRRGRLKLFFGASPGVGKTFAMLAEARERKAAGVDIVVGYVETHKRPETLALLDGQEQLPPKWVLYHGVRLREFDLDAALARKPALILVDELAHTNAEGLRHAKRWQDVVELLDAGIDVYTTVNVQHVETLNDVVAQITGVIVRETIPDAIIERADEIELIDLPPDDLLQRLREGKVYVPEQAERATQNFFRKEILVALRELALRQTADRVNRQVQVERAGRSIDRNWATRERLLVCVGPSPLSARVVRTARRMAASLQCEWIAVAVDTPTLNDAARERVRRHLRLAENLGADAITLTGERVADELIAFARKRSVTKILIGKPSLPRWREWLRGSVVDEIIRLSGDIDVHVVKGDPEEIEAEARGVPARAVDWRGYGVAVGTVALCTALSWPLYQRLAPVNLTMIYLAGVVFAATRLTTGPAAVCAMLSALAFDFFFTVPYYSFAITDAQYSVAFIVLLLTALVVSGLTQRVRRQAESIRTRYHRTAALYFMSRQLAAAPNRDLLVRISGRHVSDVFQGEAVILLPDADRGLASVDPLPQWLVGNEFAAAQWVFAHQRWAGRGTDTLPASRAIYVPLIASGRPLGVLALNQKAAGALEADQRHMLETFATQLAIALERTAFAEEAAGARIATESEQMRSALLSCVSHDLRTPLATIAGSAGTLLQGGAPLSDEQRAGLLRSIADESERMNELVGKLLDMTRLESPGFHLTCEWYPLPELVGSALTRLERRLHGHQVVTDVPGAQLVLADGVLIEQVLVNLIENAAKYTPPGSTIRISAREEATLLRVEVDDDGPGLPAGSEATVFEKFVREQPHQDRRGVGLGLAICKAIVRLHGGQIGASTSVSGGACFWFTLPRGTPPVMPEQALSANDTKPAAQAGGSA